MIKQLFLCFLIFFLAQYSFSQKKYSEIDTLTIPETHCKTVLDLATYIKQSFTTDSARLRAIFVWVAKNISYNVNLRSEKEKNPQMARQTVEDVLRDKSSVCQGYAELFVALCKNLSIRAIKVSGYGKSRDVVQTLSHAWVAVQLKDEWFLFDPTWGSGYVNNKNQYVKLFNDNFYKRKPIDFIKDHMPFDPIFQFLSYPIKNSEFIDGTINKNKILFNYSDSVEQYLKLPPQHQYTAELRRLEWVGTETSLLQERKTYLLNSLQGFYSKNSIEDGNKTFSKGISLFNNYVNQKNKRFDQLNDNELAKLIDSIEHFIEITRTSYSDIIVKNEEQQSKKIINLQDIDRFYARFKKEQLFVEEYISTDKAYRNKLFSKKY